MVASTVVALVLALTGCKSSEPFEYPPTDRTAWTQALANSHDRPARVVVISDSIGELSLGFTAVWDHFHQQATPADRGVWYPPNRFVRLFGWPLLSGTPAPVGLELRGQELRPGDGPAGSHDPTPIPTSLDLYYTAQPEGCLLEVRIGGEVVAVVDTSLDERGAPVDAPLGGQRWRSEAIGADRTWSVTPTGTGSALVEAMAFPPAAGIAVHGTGTSGASTRNLLDSGYPRAHLEAMVARGEAPDLVVWAADTADSHDRPAQAQALIEAIAMTREVAPGATIAHYIPPGHNDRVDWPEWVGMYTFIDEAMGVVVLDGFAAAGDVSNSADPFDLSYDGVHLSPAGQVAIDQMMIDSLTP